MHERLLLGSPRMWQRLKMALANACSDLRQDQLDRLLDKGATIIPPMS